MDGSPSRERPPADDEGPLDLRYGDDDVEGTAAQDGSRLAATLRYAALGWYVHPLRPGRKEPLTEHGCLDASIDAHDIETWWGRWPEANVGVALEPSGLAVLDIDPRNGGSTAELHAACDMGSPLIARTGGGGWHYVYGDRGVELRSSLGYAGLDGIDVKRNGYIVVAPSVTTGFYQWTDEVGTAAPMPSMVLDLTRAPAQRERDLVVRRDDPLTPREQAYIDAAVNDACVRLASTPVGYRHNAVYYTARSLGEYVGGGVLDEARAWKRVVQAAEQLYSEGLNATETKTIEQGLAKGKAEPRAVPDEWDGARRLLVRIAQAEDPMSIIELYHENSPELLRHFPNPALDVEIKDAHANVFAVGGETAEERFAQLIVTA